ncbi:long-chain fatty acid--CoA ligase, partial [Paracoccaceae bacterium]|nr:long-chain fatty acid--CoA ligase [Paracoccaceae bacterium]
MIYFDWSKHQAKMRPNKVAIKDYYSGNELTYLGLEERALRISKYLKKNNIGQGDRVALISKNNSVFFELQFACAKTGSILVPLNWRLTAPEISFILKDCEPKLLIFDKPFKETVCSLENYPNSMKSIEFDSSNINNEFSSAWKQFDTDFKEIKASLSDLITIMYTSGTTGNPKGAKINHMMNLFNVINICGTAGITSKTVQLVILPLFHTGGLNMYANPVIHQGGEIVIMREFDPADALDAINNSKYSISHLFGVPAPLQFMMQNEKFKTVNFNTLKVVGVGGAPCAEVIIQNWQEKKVEVIQGWGMTETSPSGTVLSPEDSKKKIGSVGKPLMHTSIKIVDKTFRQVSENEIGELLIKGPNITPGYWKNEVATKDAFHKGWLKSGDLAREDKEGFIYIVDREKDMFISGGENVYPAEVENIIYQLEEIAELAVIGVPHPTWGETGKLCVVLKKNRQLPKDKIIKHCSKSLAKFKIPTVIEYMEALPRNATGKVLKRVLKEKS